MPEKAKSEEFFEFHETFWEVCPSRWVWKPLSGSASVASSCTDPCSGPASAKAVSQSSWNASQTAFLKDHLGFLVILGSVPPVRASMSIGTWSLPKSGLTLHLIRRAWVGLQKAASGAVWPSRRIGSLWTSVGRHWGSFSQLCRARHQSSRWRRWAHDWGLESLLEDGLGAVLGNWPSWWWYWALGRLSCSGYTTPIDRDHVQLCFREPGDSSEIFGRSPSAFHNTLVRRLCLARLRRYLRLRALRRLWLPGRPVCASPSPSFAAGGATRSLFIQQAWPRRLLACWWVHTAK